MKAIAPDGYEPRVRVFVAGREAPIEPDYVETRRGEHEPWVRFQALGAEPGEKADPESYWAHVHEQLIERVEIHFDRIGARPTGFSYSEKEPPA